MFPVLINCKCNSLQLCGKYAKHAIYLSRNTSSLMSVSQNIITIHKIRVFFFLFFNFDVIRRLFLF